MRTKSRQSKPIKDQSGRDARADSIQSCTIEWSRRIYKRGPNGGETKSEDDYDLDTAKNIISSDPIFQTELNLWIPGGGEQPQELAVPGHTIIARLKESAGVDWALKKLPLPAVPTSPVPIPKVPIEEPEDKRPVLPSLTSSTGVSDLNVSEDTESAQGASSVAPPKSKSAIKKSLKNKAQRARKSNRNKSGNTSNVSLLGETSENAECSRKADDTLMSGALHPDEATQNEILGNIEFPSDDETIDDPNLLNVLTPSSSHGDTSSDQDPVETKEVKVRDEGLSARTNPPPSRANTSCTELIAHTRRLVNATLKEVDLKTSILRKEHQKENLEHFSFHGVLKYDEAASENYFKILQFEAGIERLCIVEEPFRVDPNDESGLASLIRPILDKYTDSKDGPLAQIWLSFIQLALDLQRIDGGYDRLWSHLSEEDRTHIQSLRNIHHEVVKTIVEDLKIGKDVGYIDEMRILTEYQSVLSPRKWFHFVGLVGEDTRKYLKVLVATSIDKTIYDRYFTQKAVVNNLIAHTAGVHYEGAPEHIRRRMKENADRQTAVRKAIEKEESERAEAAKSEDGKALDGQGEQDTDDNDTKAEDLDLVTYAQYQGLL